MLAIGFDFWHGPQNLDGRRSGDEASRTASSQGWLKLILPKGNHCCHHYGPERPWPLGVSSVAVLGSERRCVVHIGQVRLKILIHKMGSWCLSPRMVAWIKWHHNISYHLWCGRCHSKRKNLSLANLSESHLKGWCSAKLWGEDCYPTRVPYSTLLPMSGTQHLSSDLVLSSPFQLLRSFLTPIKAYFNQLSNWNRSTSWMFPFTRDTFILLGWQLNAPPPKWDDISGLWGTSVGRGTECHAAWWGSHSMRQDTFGKNAAFHTQAVPNTRWTHLNAFVIFLACLHPYAALR